MYPINPIVVDLSHWDPAKDYAAVKNAGVVGVIFKATQGVGYTDDKYASQRTAAKAAGLLWGAYHFADRSDATMQAQRFIKYAAIEPGDLFCLDWEDNNGDKMNAAQAQEWMIYVEQHYQRTGSCVLYSGNTAKELLHGKNEFFGARRLWLAQYSDQPTCQESWEKPWLWQFTDGHSGHQPHSMPGIGHCDINSFDRTADDLRAEWADGKKAPPTAEVA